MKIPNPKLQKEKIEKGKGKEKPPKVLFSFSNNVDNKFCLYMCEKNEVKDFEKFLKHAESFNSHLEFRGSMCHGKPRVEKIDDFEDRRTLNLGNDISIYSLRVDKEKRLYGFWEEHIFHIIYFDPHHESLRKSANAG